MRPPGRPNAGPAREKCRIAPVSRGTPRHVRATTIGSLRGGLLDTGARGIGPGHSRWMGWTDFALN